MEEDAAATLAGVLISMGGALAAMVALYRLGRDIIDRNTGHRASFYLLIAPASMFLAMVYTEGLFLGLSFSSLMFARERRFAPAGILAFGATLTKAAGALLLLPLFLYWYRSESRKALFAGKKKTCLDLIFVAAPALAYALFYLVMSRPFHFVESFYFGRNLLALSGTLAAWKGALGLMITSPQSLAYYMVEIACLAVGGISVLWIFRHDKVLALYSIAALLFSITSGVAQGMHRYVLALPSFFLLPAALGRHRSFDRAWVMVNLPFMVMLMTTFVADHWAG